MFWAFICGWNACMAAIAMNDGHPKWADLFAAFAVLWLIVAIIENSQKDARHD